MYNVESIFLMVIPGAHRTCLAAALLRPLVMAATAVEYVPVEVEDDLLDEL